MRDTHRLKEKYELSLDNRQIVTVTVASLVVLGGAFMLGVVVGKKLSAEAAHQQIEQKPTDLLGQLDRQNDVLDNVKADAAFTFQDELTRQVPVPVIQQPVAVKVEEVKALETSKAAEPVAAIPKPAPEPKLADTPKAEAVATRTVDGGGLKEAFGKAQRPPTQTAANGAWTLQLSAYQDKAEADRFMGTLRNKGYAPYIVEATLPGKGTWYRVRMGRFANREAAARYMEDFRRETAMNAMVTSVN